MIIAYIQSRKNKISELSIIADTQNIAIIQLTEIRNDEKNNRGKKSQIQVTQISVEKNTKGGNRERSRELQSRKDCGEPNEGKESKKHSEGKQKKGS